MTTGLLPPPDPRIVSPPRPVRLRQGGALKLWLPRLFILPHMLVGAGILFFALFLTSMLIFGTPADGAILEKEVTQGKNGPSYTLHYRYRYDGVDFQDHDQVGSEMFQSREPGDHVTVIVHALLPGTGPRLDGNLEGWSLVVAWIFAFFWNVIVGVFVRLLWIIPHRQRRLVQSGETAAGVITRKEMKGRGRNTRRTLHYEFTPALPALTSMGSPLSGSMAVGGEDYASAAEGESVLVLYDTARPRRNCLSRCALYEISTG